MTQASECGDRMPLQGCVHTAYAGLETGFCVLVADGKLGYRGGVDSSEGSILLTERALTLLFSWCQPIKVGVSVGIGCIFALIARAVNA